MSNLCENYTRLLNPPLNNKGDAVKTPTADQAKQLVAPTDIGTLFEDCIGLFSHDFQNMNNIIHFSLCFLHLF